MMLAEDDQQVKLRHARPDLDEALEQQIDQAAVEALHRAGGDADAEEMMVSVKPNSTEMRKP